MSEGRRVMMERPRDGVVVGIDGSTSAEAAARWAARTAVQRGERLRLLHALAWPQPQFDVAGQVAVGEPYDEELQSGAESMLATLASALEYQFPGVRVESEVVLGAASSVLLEQAPTASLVVVGSRGLGGFAGLLVGSVGTQLSAHSPVPVVVVHG